MYVLCSMSREVKRYAAQFSAVNLKGLLNVSKIALSCSASFFAGSILKRRFESHEFELLQTQEHDSFHMVTQIVNAK